MRKENDTPVTVQWVMGNMSESVLVVVVVAQSLPTPWARSRQAPLSMGVLRQEYWSGLPFLSPGDLPRPGIELESSALAGGSFTMEPPGKPISVPVLPKKNVANWVT